MKKRVRKLISLERTDLGEQNQIEWYEEEEFDEPNEVVKKEKDK
jgi:hypothetical protein